MPGRKDLCGAVGTSFHAKQWLSLDACGLFGVSFSWFVHFYALIVCGALLISDSLVATSIYFALYVPTSFLAMASLYRAWTTNPGAVPMGARPLTLVRRASTQSLSGNKSGDNNKTTTPGEPPRRRRAVRRCHKCEDNYKPPRAHHDSVTGRCIVKFDHFCPWVGNSIGAMNHKFFCLFLFYTALSCIISLFLLLIRVIHCGYLINAEEKAEALSDTTQGYREREENPMRLLEEAKAYRYPECNDFYASPFVMGLLVASLVFLVFTLTMGCEQVEAIETGKGKIARMKMKVGQAGTEFSRVTEEFNEMFGGTSPRVSWHWLWPDAVMFPKGMKKVVLGYEWDPTYDFEAYESDHGSDQEMEEMENGKAVSRVPSSLGAEGDGLVEVPPVDDISMSDVSSHGDDLPPGMKNRKATSRQETAESEGALPSPSNLPRIS
mmetsp:Transcript_1920/g.3790  ORF Transcript_1920/g.3790 Transcript_1920/m.3790 type:complete len:436 (+) Transcript_1920:376-1683(+)